MADAPYDPETGEWTVFADPRPDKEGPYEKAVAHVPGERDGSTPTQVLLWGDVKRAESYYPQAAQLLAQANRENVNDQPFFFKERKLGGDVRFKCRRDLYQDFIEIEAKPGIIPPGAMHLNFDPSVQKEFELGVFDKNYGLQLYYNETTDGFFNISENGLTCSTNNELFGSSATGRVYYKQKNIHSQNKTYIAAVTFANTCDHSLLLQGSESFLYSGFNVYNNDYNHIEDIYKWYLYTWLNGEVVSLGWEPSSSINLKTNAIIIFSCEISDLKYTEDKSTNFYTKQNFWLNGNLIDSLTESQNMWGAYNSYYKNLYAYKTYFNSDSTPQRQDGYITAHQMMFIDGLASSDDISRLTDELAKKWGF